MVENLTILEFKGSFLNSKYLRQNKNNFDKSDLRKIMILEKDSFKFIEVDLTKKNNIL
jgi:hypothetical protein